VLVLYAFVLYLLEDGNLSLIHIGAVMCMNKYYELYSHKKVYEKHKIQYT